MVRYSNMQKRATTCETIVKDIPISIVNSSLEDEFTASVHVQTDLQMKDINDLIECNNNYMQENITLKNTVKNCTLSEETFENDDERTIYYTGIKFETLMIILNLISSSLSQTTMNALSPFQQLLLSLMHIRLNLDFKDLGYRFRVSRYTISRIFHNCLYILYVKLQNFIYWPSPIALKSNMPLCFTNAFGDRVSVIIDCFEVFIERPSNLLASAQTWSNYKHHNTIKFLITICPQGAICFVSKAWGGRVSDKHLTLNCGFLEKLLPGDVVLADRGFKIHGEAKLYCAEVKTPASTLGKKQLSPFEVEDTRKLASVRIHVERVIGSLRQKFRILHDIMPISLISKSVPNVPAVVDQIVIVSCALYNMCPPIITE